MILLWAICTPKVVRGLGTSLPWDLGDSLLYHTWPAYRPRQAPCVWSSTSVRSLVFQPLWRTGWLWPMPCRALKEKYMSACFLLLWPSTKIGYFTKRFVLVHDFGGQRARHKHQLPLLPVVRTTLKTDEYVERKEGTWRAERKRANTPTANSFLREKHLCFYAGRVIMVTFKRSHHLPAPHTGDQVSTGVSL